MTGEMNALRGIVLLLCLAPVLASAFDTGANVECHHSFKGDFSMYALGPRLTCQCGVVGCGLVDVTLEPGPVTVGVYLGMTAKARWEEENKVWIGESPEMFINVRLHTKKYDRYVLYYVCTEQGDFNLVEFPNTTAATGEVLKEVLAKHHVDISPEFLLDC